MKLASTDGGVTRTGVKSRRDLFRPADRGEALAERLVQLVVGQFLLRTSSVGLVLGRHWRPWIRLSVAAIRSFGPQPLNSSHRRHVLLIAPEPVTRSSRDQGRRRASGGGIRRVVLALSGGAANVGQVSELLPNLDVCPGDAACALLSGGRRVPAYAGLGVGCPLTFNRSAGRPV